MNFYYEGILRMDWGFGNPNRTAALIAMLMIVAWIPASFHKRLFWVSLVAFTGLGVCLIQTFSRGGIVAAVVGGAILLWQSPRPRLRVAAVIACLLGLGIYSISLSAADRYADAWQGDRSVTHRLDLWKSVPQMMADAPGGWGLGHSQEAYMQWYQPLDRKERFLNLVSMHFTLLAELSWLGRFFYLFAWLTNLLIAWPDRKMPAFPLAILATFFAAGSFTHPANSWALYVLPLLAVAFAIGWRIRSRQSPPAHHFAVTALAAAFLCAGFYFVGAHTKDQAPLHGNSKFVIVGKTPSAWVVINTTVLGANYGKTFRRYVAGHDLSLGFIRRIEDIPDNSIVVLSGTQNSASAQMLAQKLPARIILLNPTIFPQEIPHPVTVIFGEFSTSPSQSSWQAKGKVQTLAGIGDYISDWPAILAETANRP